MYLRVFWFLEPALSVLRYVVLVFFCLLNFLLAIIVDAYAKVAESAIALTVTTQGNRYGCHANFWPLTLWLLTVPSPLLHCVRTCLIHVFPAHCAFRGVRRGSARGPRAAGRGARSHLQLLLS